MMVIYLVVSVLAVIKQELYEYQTGFIITQPQEDFVMSYKEIDDKSLNKKTILVNNCIALVSESNHIMDKIIDMKQNHYEQEDYTWILYQTNDKSILSKQSIGDWSEMETYYLQLIFECYTFYFISQSQIVVDCQDSISNIVVLYDIKNKLQQSFYYSHYKDVKLRNMFQIYESSSLVLIQQHQFLVICLIQNKYQICNQLNIYTNAHTAHIYNNQITLVSDYHLDVYDIIFLDNQSYQVVFEQQLNLTKLNLFIKYPLVYFLLHPHNFHIYIVSQKDVQICYESCAYYILDNPPIKVSNQKNYLIIQTNSKIYIFCMINLRLFEIKRQFSNDFIIANRELEEFYVATKSHLSLYGITQRIYLRITNQTLLIDQITFLNYYEITSYEYEKSNIQFDPNFQFKRYKLLDQFQNFLLIGGIFHINFIVEEQFQKIILVNYSHFIEVEIQQGVQQFYLDTDRQNFTQLKTYIQLNIVC